MISPRPSAVTAPASRALPRRRPRAAASDLDVLGALGGAEQSARQLADDLAALVRAGLVSPVRHDGELSFAIAEFVEPAGRRP